MRGRKKLWIHVARARVKRSCVVLVGWSGKANTRRVWVRERKLGGLSEAGQGVRAARRRRRGERIGDRVNQSVDGNPRACIPYVRDAGGGAPSVAKALCHSKVVWIKEENAKQRANPQPPTLDGNGGGHSPIPACPSHASSTDSIVTNVAAFSILSPKDRVECDAGSNTASPGLNNPSCLSPSPPSALPSVRAGDSSGSGCPCGGPHPSMPLERRAGSAPSAGGGQDFGGVRRGGGVMRVARGRDPGVRVRSGRGVERYRDEFSSTTKATGRRGTRFISYDLPSQLWINMKLYKYRSSTRRYRRNPSINWISFNNQFHIIGPDLWEIMRKGMMRRRRRG
ncbi:hypothetical protein B0H14DRAFT_3645366 [Mycena olivaceomarginata]|nr:hypothetical protein B0H14DRAFT_3645366 [Mycena olivaceomarginata]